MTLVYWTFDYVRKMLLAMSVVLWNDEFWL